MPLQVPGTVLSGLLADFRQAVDVNPALSDCYYNLGNAEFELGHYEESILVSQSAGRSIQPVLVCALLAE